MDRLTALWLMAFLVFALQQRAESVLEGMSKDAMKKLPKIQPVLNKFEAFASNKIDQTNLDLMEIQEYGDYFYSMNENDRTILRNMIDVFALLDDVVFKSVRSLKERVGNLWGERYERRYVKLLEHTYKELRPYYLGVSDSPKYRGLPSIDTVCSILAGYNSYIPLTRKLLQDARTELRGFYKRMSEIMNDDNITVNFKELRALLSHTNRPDVKIFDKHILKQVDAFNGSPEEVEALKRIFQEKLARKGFVVASKGDNDGQDNAGSVTRLIVEEPLIVRSDTTAREFF